MSYLTPANAQSRLGVAKPWKATATATPAELVKSEVIEEGGKTRIEKTYDIIKE